MKGPIVITVIYTIVRSQSDHIVDYLKTNKQQTALHPDTQTPYDSSGEGR